MRDIAVGREGTQDLQSANIRKESTVVRSITDLSSNKTKIYAATIVQSSPRATAVWGNGDLEWTRSEFEKCLLDQIQAIQSLQDLHFV